MRRTNERYNRGEDEDDEYEGGRARAPRREYDDTEREFLNRSRHRDEGQYGRAYGGRYQPSFESTRDDEDRDESDFESRRARMGWGRSEEEGGRERRRDDDDERRGYWSQSRPGEFGGRSAYGRANEEDEFRGGRSRQDYGSSGSGRGREEDYGTFRAGRPGGPSYGSERGRREDEGFGRRDYHGGDTGRSRGTRDFDDEDRVQFSRGGRSYRAQEAESRGAESTGYIGGRHAGGNIGQSQMDYGEQGYRRGGRGSSRWEDEDVVTRGRGQQQGDGGRYMRGESSMADLEDEERGGNGRREAGGRGRTSSTSRPAMGKASQRTRTSMGRDKLGAGARKKSRVRREEHDEGEQG